MPELSPQRYDPILLGNKDERWRSTVKYSRKGFNAAH
jgi:hypothetical protein